MVRGVIFDMDGLMLDTEVVSSSCWIRAGKEMGVAITEPFTASFRGTNSNYIKQCFYKEFGPDVDYEGLRALRIQYMNQHFAEQGVPVKDGLVELLKYLKAENIPMAVATSSRRYYAEDLLKRAGLYDYFRYFMFGDLVEIAKPDPDIFLKAAAGLEVGIRDCVIFEDSPNGILAGYRAGARVIAIPDITYIPDDKRKLVTECLPNLRDAIPYIQKWRKEV